VQKIQNLHARGEPLNISAVKRSHPELIAKTYEIEPFWGWRRALEDARIRYSQIRVHLEPTVECKICRKQLRRLPQHLKMMHEVSCEDYRIDYPEVDLFSETERAKAFGRSFLTGKPASLLFPHWEPLWSHEYLLDRAFEIHRRKLPIHHVAVSRKEPSIVERAKQEFGGWDTVLSRIGLSPLHVRLSCPRYKWTKKMVVAELKRLRDLDAGMMRCELEEAGHRPLCQAGVKLFGSYDAALEAAGITPDAIRPKTPRKYTDHDRAGLHTETRRVAAIADSRKHDSEVRKFRRKYHTMVGTLYGEDCWGHAARDAGVPPERLQAAKGRYPDSSSVIRGIRRRKQAGLAINYSGLLREEGDISLLRQGRRFFGSWDAALEAAGLEPNSVRIRKRSPYQTPGSCIEAITKRMDHGLSIRPADVRAGKKADPDLHGSVRRFFGGWHGVFETMGIDPTVVTERRQRKAHSSSKNDLPT